MEGSCSAGIIGIGSYLPEKSLTNSDLEKIVDTSDEWIIKRTGIKTRKILDDATPAHEMGAIAAKRAMDNAGKKAEDIDYIIVTTETPDYLTPSTACLIQKKIGAVNAAAVDINAACSGFVYGLTIAEQFIKTGYYKNVLLISCEGLTRIVDWNDRSTCVLFGDAAGAVIVGRVAEGEGIISTHIGAEGELGDCLTLPCCYVSEVDKSKRNEGQERTLWMDGGTVFSFACRAMAEATESVLEKAKVSIEKLSMLFPHQANMRIITNAAKRLGLPVDRIYANLENTGNISSASIPVGLDDAHKSKRIKKGDNVAIVAFGGGLTWGSALLKWCID